MVNNMNLVLKKVGNLDRTIEKNFKETGFSLPSEVDLLFKWLPAFFVLIADATGVKTKNHFIQKVILLALSEVILNSIVQPFKKLVYRRRPGSFFKFNSFPSSHTATSFSGAVILHEETKEHSFALSLTGYPVAIITAALRLYKRKHWFSDIIAGAIIGIASARISYRLYKTLSG
jgi:membrane-associated phospholipid phosphatase